MGKNLIIEGLYCTIKSRTIVAIGYCVTLLTWSSPILVLTYLFSGEVIKCEAKKFGEEEAAIHLILIGHAGAGKTSTSRHLEEKLFDENEPATIVMNSKIIPIEDKPDCKVSLNIWDTGGHPVFQDLLPCFARLMCVYSIVFRLTDIDTFDDYPEIRPYNKDQSKKVSPFTNREIMYRNLAYIHVYTSGMQSYYKNEPILPSATNFPGAIVIGTFKDKLSSVSKDSISKLNDDIRKLAHSNEWPIYPVSPGSSTYIYKIDNTNSGTLYEDQDIRRLKKTLSSCASRFKTDNKWKSFEIALQNKCRSDSICVMPLWEAIQVGKECKVESPLAALKYFHDLGIFMWYHLSKRESLHGFVVIKPKVLLNIFSEIFCLDSQSIPLEHESLFARGVVTSSYFNQLLKNNTSNITNQWFVDFLEEHHLISKVCFDDHGICYFIPSLLCIKSDYREKAEGIKSAISPLYIVPQSGYIATGLFTRLLTALSKVYKIPSTDKFEFCRNQYIFEVYSNNISKNVDVILSEYSKFIRVDCVHSSDVHIDEDTYFFIASTLEVQLQRIVPLWINKKGFNLSFSCKNIACLKNEIHFFSNNNILFESTDKMLCSNNNYSSLDSFQEKWCRNKLIQVNGK